MIAKIAHIEAPVGKHHSLAKERAHFGAAYVEHIAEVRQIGERNVALGRSQSVAQASTIDKQGQIEPLASAVDVGELLFRIYGAYLGGKRDVYHTRLHHMFRTILGEVIGHSLLYLNSRNLARIGRKSQHLVSGVLNGTRFVHIDVPGVGANHALIGAEQRSDDGGVGLRATHQKVHRSIGAANSLDDGTARPGTIAVLAVARCLLQISCYKALHYCRMRSLVVVALKLYHRFEVIY